MVQSLFFILTVGFFIQCTESNTFLKRTFMKTAICSDDAANSKGWNNKEYKSDQEKLTNFQNLEFNTSHLLFSIFQNSLFYPAGNISDPLLPPLASSQLKRTERCFIRYLVCFLI